MHGSASPTKRLFVKCAEGVSAACDEAYAAVKPAIQRTVRRVCFQYGSPHEAEDLIQDVSLKVIARQAELPSVLPDDEPAVVAYISILAANVARDFFRSRDASKRGHRTTSQLDEASERHVSEIVGHTPLDRQVFLTQLEELLSGSDRERAIFRLYYRQGFTADEIAQIPALQLTTKGVESLLHRMSKSLREKANRKANSAGGRL